MLEAALRRVLPLALVERRALRVAGTGRRIGIVGVARRNGVALITHARGEIGVGPHRHRAVTVERRGRLLDVVGVIRRRVEVLRTVLQEAGVVVVEAGEELRWQAERVGVDLQARRDRRGGQLGVDTVIGRAVEEQLGLLLLAAQAAVEDQLHAGRDGARDAEHEVLALLVGIVVRRSRAGTIGHQQARGRRHQPPARQPEFLVVDDDVEISAALTRRPTEIAVGASLVQLAVLAIAVGGQAERADRGRERTRRTGD